MCPHNTGKSGSAPPPSAPPAAAYPPQILALPDNKLNEWSTGFCSCVEDSSSCFTACCCPCITFGQNAEIIDLGTTSWVTAGLVYLLLAPVCCSWAYTWTYRRKLRILYGLKEGPCADYIVHCCCQLCSVSQEYRELQNHGFDPSVGWIANADRLNRGGARPTAPPPTATPMAR